MRAAKQVEELELKKKDIEVSIFLKFTGFCIVSVSRGGWLIERILHLFLYSFSLVCRCRFSIHNSPCCTHIWIVDWCVRTYFFHLQNDPRSGLNVTAQRLRVCDDCGAQVCWHLFGIPFRFYLRVWALFWLRFLGVHILSQRCRMNDFFVSITVEWVAFTFSYFHFPLQFRLFPAEHHGPRVASAGPLWGQNAPRNGGNPREVRRDDGRFSTTKLRLIDSLGELWGDQSSLSLSLLDVLCREPTFFFI